ncbi:MAG: class A beta-lactamase-related serine hydrolase [Actinobacteria bacterium]|nr:class A beta-lactamase-related serine hydrolase [Actinomycetota bacterium]
MAGLARLTIILAICVVACTRAVTTPMTTTIGLGATEVTTTTATPRGTTTTLTDATTGDLAPCRPDIFTVDLVTVLAADYPNQLITAHVHDLRTGCDYTLNTENRQRTASVIKVMVMAGTLLEAQNEGRPVSEWEMSQLTPMITESTNDEVRALWNHFGGSPWFREQGEIFGLTETRITADDGSSWGRTTTSARDQVELLRQVLIGEWGPLNAQSRLVAYYLMTSVVPSQTWGVTAGVPPDWVVAQKNGFAGIVINSVGWADEPGPSPGYVVAILSQGWPDHPSGIAAVERVSLVIAEAMTR